MCLKAESFNREHTTKRFFIYNDKLYIKVTKQYKSYIQEKAKIKST